MPVSVPAGAGDEVWGDGCASVSPAGAGPVGALSCAVDGAAVLSCAGDGCAGLVSFPEWVPVELSVE
ncbi:hypothetical protein [Nocardia nova]|uniref:hypothetical protein n=1 Tax=Nocardia nova TaxID=37330 RepID=UPI00189620BD|nr:hypothetical protein [Nocardia nova]MBF6144938.1 hypothetical protein [Nocardia nova]